MAVESPGLRAQSRPLRILQVSSEVESLARPGGLGDGVEALSRSLEAGSPGQRPAEVVIATPKYGVTRVPPGARWWASPVVAPLGLGHARSMGVLEARLGPRGPRVCMLADTQLFDRDGIYGDRTGAFEDNAFRFAALSSGALSLAERAWDGALPDVIHAHDWHAALAVLYARFSRGAAWARVPTIFTIHNLAFQGVIGESEMGYLAIPPSAWEAGWIRHEGRVNLMKGAIEIADRVTTVSERYAKEIQHPAHGFGLHTHLAWHTGKLAGIVNGIDTDAFDPRTDGAIARRYGEADALEGKLACKNALCWELGLDAGGPLFGNVSRLQWLKGIDMMLDIAPALVDRGARLVLVGKGEPGLESALRDVAARFPGRIASRVAFDPLLARRIYAGSDFIVVPSRDEPCGLTQLYAMRYGAVPVVTPVGGLVDTVRPLNLAYASGEGLVAEAPDPMSLLVACEDARSIWGDGIAWPALMARAMARDSSWPTSARKYVELYEGLSGAG